ncbi:MAG: NifB/NifX family molybdenum-iron cluster-binding protein [Chloroflexi bacterium]|nr:NifB/NifX family molybdenum-iron cluster-binding protein [Chloroflexota bacterium]
MKLAAITEDGHEISQHFGRAPYYLVLTIDDGKITHREMRDKLGHAHFGGEEHHEEPGHAHGLGPQAHDRHLRMAEAIADCEVLLCGGMGQGAYESIQACGLRPIVTDLTSIDEAAAAYLNGTLIDLTDRLH